MTKLPGRSKQLHQKSITFGQRTTYRAKRARSTATRHAVSPRTKKASSTAVRTNARRFRPIRKSLLRLKPRKDVASISRREALTLSQADLRFYRLNEEDRNKHRRYLTYLEPKTLKVTPHYLRPAPHLAQSLRTCHLDRTNANRRTVRQVTRQRKGPKVTYRTYTSALYADSTKYVPSAMSTIQFEKLPGFTGHMLETGRKQELLHRRQRPVPATVSPLAP